MTTEPRTGTTILGAHECWALLRAAEVGRLAIAILNRPDIFPVNHLVDDRTIVLRMAEGTTLAGAVLGQDVAYEVDGYDAENGDAWSVVVKGRVVEQRLHELFDACDLPMFPWHATAKPRFARIEPVSVSGRRFHVVDYVAMATPSTGLQSRTP